MSVPNVEVRRTDEGFWIKESGQPDDGMLITHGWLKDNGFGTLTRSNIDEVIKATIFVANGGVMQPMKRLPKDLGHLKNPRQFAVDGLRESVLVVAKR